MTISNTPGSPFPTSTGSDAPMGDAASRVADNVATLGVGSDKTLERIVQGAHQAVDSFAAKAAPAVEKLKTGVSTASESLHQRADQLKTLEEEWVENARATVREHPIASIAAAVALGMLISRLTSSR